MNNLFKGLIAGWGAKKLGGGCFSMIIIFIIIWVVLGQCEGSSYGESRFRNKNTPELRNGGDLLASQNTKEETQP